MTLSDFVNHPIRDQKEWIRYFGLNHSGSWLRFSLVCRMCFPFILLLRVTIYPIIRVIDAMESLNRNPIEYRCQKNLTTE